MVESRGLAVSYVHCGSFSYCFESAENLYAACSVVLFFLFLRHFGLDVGLENFVFCLQGSLVFENLREYLNFVINF